jgi:hypothetical protein
MEITLTSTKSSHVARRIQGLCTPANAWEWDGMHML